jgi:hypothetical protein
MARLTKKRKLALLVLLALIIAVHLALFSAGGSYRILAEVLLVIDVVSGFFIVAAVREFRKLDD